MTLLVKKHCHGQASKTDFNVTKLFFGTKKTFLKENALHKRALTFECLLTKEPQLTEITVQKIGHEIVRR